MPNARSHAERVSEGTIPGGGMWQTWRVFHQELVCEDAVVDSVVSAYHLGYPQAEYHNFGLWIRADSATAAPELTVRVLQSWDDHQENYAVTDVGIWIMSNVPEVWKLDVPPMRFLRIRVIGQTGNPRDTFVDTYLFMQRG